MTRIYYSLRILNLYFVLNLLGDVFVWIRSFSLPEFVAEVQEAIKPVLNAYMKVSAELMLNV